SFYIRLPSISTLFPYTTLFRSLMGKLLLTINDSDGTKNTASIGSTGRLFDFNQFDPRTGQRYTPETSSGINQRRLQSDYGVFHRSEEHTSELQSLRHLVCRLLL